MATRTGTLLRVATSLGGIALSVMLIRRLGADNLLSQLWNVGTGIIWLMLAYAAGTSVSALPWHWLLPRQARPPLPAVFSSRFAAAGVNAILPFLGIGGEPCRLLWLPPQERRPGLAALVVDRALFSVASGLFLSLGLLAAWSTAISPIFIWIGLATVLCAFVLAAAIAWAGVRRKVATPISRLLQRLRFRGGGETGTAGEEIDLAMANLFRKSRQTLLAGTAVHIAGRLLLAAEVYAGLRVLHFRPTACTVMVIASVPIALSIAGALVPSQIGLQEGAQFLVFRALGIDPTIGMSLVLLQRIRQVAFVSLAMLLLGSARSGRGRSVASKVDDNRSRPNS
ncbi:MAG: lysylphosphatidylglycerol synthase domain-containing protein [Pseudomonadota bacterium]